MKHLFLTASIAFFFFGKISSQSLVFQDSTFTAPLVLSNVPEFVSFQNCRFINIVGAALTLNKSGAVLSGCTFENIEGIAISLDSCEVYLVNDTLRNIAGKGVDATFSTVVVQGSIFSQISDAALTFNFCDLAEVSDCDISDVGQGVSSSMPSTGQVSILNTNIRRLNGQSAPAYAGSAIIVSDIGIVEIEGVSIDSCLAYGIYLYGFNVDPLTSTVSIQGNTISRANRGGIYGNNVYNGIIRGNEVSYPGFLGEGGGCITWSGTNARIENNHLHHAIRIDNNPFFSYSGILLETSGTVARNHIHDCTDNGIGYSTLNGFTLESLLIFNNIIHDVGGNPIGFGGGSIKPTETIIRNNTLHAKPIGSLAQNAPIAIYSTGNPVTAQGNIFIYEGVADTASYVHLASGSTLTENLNLKVSGDIGFVDYAGRDFHLASESSDAVDFLPLDFGLPNDDFDGTPRFGLHDAGADELVRNDTVCGCVNCPTEIPDSFFGEFIFSVGSAGNNNLANPSQGVCGVRIDFEHEYLGDLNMELTSPAGQTVQLVGPSGFWGSTEFSFWSIGFTPCGGTATPDPGFSAIWNSNQAWGEFGIYTGIYYPSNGCLEDFNMGSVTGDWILRVTDNQAVDAGIVHNVAVIFCDPMGLSCVPCSEPPVAFFATNPIGAWGVGLQNQSTGNPSLFKVDFGDGQSSSGPALISSHIYEDSGTYVVRLIVINDCGVDTFLQTVHIAGTLPIVNAFAQPIAGCAPLDVQTTISYADHADTWHWLFPGGSPSESFEMEPSVVYAMPGEYPITLIVGNEVGADTIESITSIAVLPTLVDPSFSIQVMGDSIICTNTTQNVESLFWTINGGTPTGINISPQVFEVAVSGLYTISLHVTNICGTIVLTDTVTVILSGTKNLEDEGWQVSLAPNPNDGHFNLAIAAPERLSANVSVLNALGQEVFFQKTEVFKGENQVPLDMGQLPAGLYNLNLQTQHGSAVLRFVIR